MKLIGLTIIVDFFFFLTFLCHSKDNHVAHIRCALGSSLKSQLILQFRLFLLLFMGPTALFDTIHESYCTISSNFYLYLQYFRQKVFNFNKIS